MPVITHAALHPWLGDPVPSPRRSPGRRPRSFRGQAGGQSAAPGGGSFTSAPGPPGGWRPRLESNQDLRTYRPVCCRCTTGTARPARSSTGAWARPASRIAPGQDVPAPTVGVPGSAAEALRHPLAAGRVGSKPRGRTVAYHSSRPARGTPSPAAHRGFLRAGAPFGVLPQHSGSSRGVAGQRDTAGLRNTLTPR